MKIIIIPLSYGTNIVNTASERIRCDWLLPYLPADKFNGGQNLTNYNVIIYQKAFKPSMAEWGRKEGKIQVVDLTDPIWLYNPIHKLKKMYQYIDIFIFSTEEMRIHFNIFFPEFKNQTYTVIDRLRLNEFKEKKVHEHKDKPILVWFGYADNFIRLSEMLPYIDENKLPLVTICERPIGYGQFIKWSNETVNKNITKGDIVLNPLNPQYLKTSFNKSSLAWALNMPVARDIEELIWFLKYERRKDFMNGIYGPFNMKKYDIRKSAKEINEIIYRFKNNVNK